MDSFITLICHNITSNIFYSMVAAIIRPRPQRRDDHRLAARFRLEKRGESNKFLRSPLLRLQVRCWSPCLHPLFQNGAAFPVRDIRPSFHRLTGLTVLRHCQPNSFRLGMLNDFMIPAYAPCFLQLLISTCYSPPSSMSVLRRL